MKEQLIEFETAKLAKDKGFKEICHSYYFEDGEFKENSLTGQNGHYGASYFNSYEEALEYALQQALKLINDETKIH